ncbi:trans-sialidase [Trypanosoma cruzi Dm28c]|uniref:Trans-sialidase n=1 Tax=Trypanosoma cruzi Dm28c TaxID=1416333 RepID=V5D3B4_TRYCR|nr:trans-sialidase [Trypanosoma cruzi Dm28c]
MNVTTNKYAGPYELWWRQFSPDGAIHPPARSSDADRTGICRLPPPREGKDDTKSGGTTAPQVNAEPLRQNEDWRQSAAADGPNTVDPSPASNTTTNTSETRPEFAYVSNFNVAPTPSERRPTPVTEPKGNPIDDAMSGLINVELPRGVDLFVPQTTLVQPKDGIVPVTTRDSFDSPSLVSAGGVIAAFFEGCMDAEYQCAQLCPFLLMWLRGTSTLCGIGPLLLVWSIKDTLMAHTVPGAAEREESSGVVLRPTTITKGNGVFPLAGGSDVSYEGVCWREGGLELKLFVGDVTNPTGGKQSGRIEWADPKPLSKLISSASHKVSGRSSLLLVAQVL